MDLKSKINVWWQLGKPVWISLGVGWVWVLFSLVIGFEFPSSGAVLVCCALISDFMFPEMTWRRVAGSIGDKLIYKSVREIVLTDREGNVHKDSEGNEYQPVAETYLCVDNKIGYGGGVWEIDLLRSVSPVDAEEKFNNGTGEIDCFSIALGKKHVERWIIGCIVLSAIIGTAIWGYAHLLSPVCSCRC